MNADLTAINGKNGTILFDPKTEVVDSAKAATIVRTLNSGSNVIANSTGHIAVNSSIIATNKNDVTFTLEAGLLGGGGNEYVRLPDGAGISFANGVTVAP